MLISLSLQPTVFTSSNLECLKREVVLLVDLCIAQKMIDWEAASGCFSKLDRRTFLALLPGNARNEIPDKGNSVIYFGDGHALSVEAEVCTAVSLEMPEWCPWEAYLPTPV